MFDNVTILLQGIINDKVDLKQTLETYTKVCNVILSVYTSDLDMVNKICVDYPNVKIVENNLEEYSNLPVVIDTLVDYGILSTIQRCYFQICTTKKGLEYVNTEYVVKSRVDHYYSGIHKFIERGIQTKKIVSSSIFVRGCKDKKAINSCRFCLSDCLFMGNTSNIKLCFDLCYEEKLLTRPETGIWKPYFIHIFKQMDIDIEAVDDDTYIKLISRFVDVYCINELGPYNIKLWASTYNNLFDRVKTTYEYLLHGCDY
jgi:hypothetical protein